MKTKNRILSTILSLCLMCGMAVPTFAADINTSGGTGATPVQLTAAATTFDVTVPTSIAITVNADGTVTCPSASAVKIHNASAGAVKVSNIAMNNGTWTLASYNGGIRDLLAQEKVNAKKLGFQLSVSGDTAATATNGNQTLTHDASKWVINPNSDLEITTAAIATAVSEAISAAENAAEVVFTIGWNTAA